MLWFGHILSTQFLLSDPHNLKETLHATYTVKSNPITILLSYQTLRAQDRVSTGNLELFSVWGQRPMVHRFRFVDDDGWLWYNLFLWDLFQRAQSHIWLWPRNPQFVELFQRTWGQHWHLCRLNCRGYTNMVCAPHWCSHELLWLLHDMASSYSQDCQATNLANVCLHLHCSKFYVLYKHRNCSCMCQKLPRKSWHYNWPPRRVHWA